MSATAVRGFSLIEFVVAVAIFAVLALGAAPMYYGFINNQRASAFTNTLVNSLNHARTEAVRQNTPMTVCASDDPRRCAHSPWSRGFIVFADAGERGVIDGDDRVIRTVEMKSPQVRVTLTGGSFVRFLPNGGLLASADRLQPVSGHETNLLATLLRGLSPIATAHADGAPAAGPHANHSEAGDQAVTSGIFTVCVGPVGRAINVNPQGRISTSQIPCS